MTQRLPPFGLISRISLHDGSKRLRDRLEAAGARNAIIEAGIAEVVTADGAARLAQLVQELDGIDVTLGLDVEGCCASNLARALHVIEHAKICAVGLGLSAFDVMDDAAREVIVRSIESHPQMRFYASGPAARRPDRIKILGRSAIAHFLAGVIAPFGPETSEVDVRAALADWPVRPELVFAARGAVSPVVINALAESSATRIYLDIDAPPAALRLVRSSERANLRQAARLFKPVLNAGARPIVVVGGAGFIGSNLADQYANDGHTVRIVDNLARAGVERNLAWLKDRHGKQVEACFLDIGADGNLGPALADASAVFHLAAQVAVTTSLEAPLEDFATNAGGALRILEHLRLTAPQTPIVFASTNKVYGCLEDVSVEARGDAWRPTDVAIDRHGLGETRPLDLRTPYGCSKGAADQYVLDYAKSFGMRTAVLRMSCVYGPRQFGTEDQGWVAHFLMRCMNGEPITIFGDGRQVRDVLHIADAVQAYKLVLAHIDEVRGRAFNLGGGADNAVSLLRVLNEIAIVAGRRPDISFSDWRSGDQPWFVADTRRLTEAVGWRAHIGWREGLRDLASWLLESGVILEPDARQVWRTSA